MLSITIAKVKKEFRKANQNDKHYFNEKMLKKKFHDFFTQNLDFELTKKQVLLQEILADYLFDSTSREILLIKGYAGTGKTTMLSLLVKTLKNLRYRTVLMAPTGRAAKVLSAYSGSQAFTIHKKIYRQKTSKDDTGRFILDKNLFTETLFIVDESSMLSNMGQEGSMFGSGRLLDDMLDFVFGGTNCKLILAGDTAQLPPVNSWLSPALDTEELRSMGYKVTEVLLDEVVRQNTDSNILLNATHLRKQMKNTPVIYPRFITGDDTDVVRLDGSVLLETISDSYAKYGVDGTMIVCRTNKRANIFNQGIRNQILFYEDEISAGDRLMIVKNNYSWLSENESLDFLANGDIVKIKRIGRYEERYGYRFLNVDILLPDYDNYELSCKIMLDTIGMETPALTMEQSRSFFYAVAEDYPIPDSKKRWKAVREDPYYSAVQVKFAYAVTCHKAQGGQWNAVFVDQGWFKEDMLDTGYLRWLYTAVTRPIKKLYLLNFKPEFYPPEQ